jgi:diguanylate cyclase (GGDEF)-like protein
MWSEEIVHYSATLIQNILGINILKACLYQQTQHLAITDSLTGLYNKHIFMEFLNKECSYSERSGNSLFLAFSDIDDFKAINDTYGHQIGDEVLRHIGHLYKTVARSSDYTARFGGDEFVWLIKDADTTDAVALIERLFNLIANSECTHRIQPHLSTGLSRYVPKRQDSAARLLARADKALYRAKAGGKMRIEVADNE